MDERLDLPSLKYCCCWKIDVEAFSLLLVTLVMSPSLLMTRTSSFDEEAVVFIEVVLMFAVPMTESENSLGVKDPVFDRVTILWDSTEIKINFQCHCCKSFFLSFFFCKKNQNCLYPNFLVSDNLDLRDSDD